MICKKSHGIVFSLMILLLALLVSCPSPYETPTTGGNENGGGTDNNGNGGDEGNNGNNGGTDIPSVETKDIIFATGKSIVITNTTETFTVDGNVTEAFWNSAVPMDNFTIQASVETPASSTIGKMAYGTDGLYVAFTGTFAENTGPVSYEGLSVHISFDTGLGQNATGYTAIIPLTQNANEEISIAHNAAPNVSALSSGKYTKKAVVSNSTFSAEMKIPYSSIGVSNLDSIKNIKINVMRFRPFAEGISTWAPTKGVYYQQDLPTVAADGTITEKTAYDLHTFNIRDCFMGDVYITPNEEYLTPSKAEILVKEPSMLGFSLSHEFITKANSYKVEMFDVFGTPMPITLSNSIKNADTFSSNLTHNALQNTGLYKIRLISESANEKKIFDIVFERENIIAIASKMQLENVRLPENTIKVEHTNASADVSAILAYIPKQVGFMFVGDPEASSESPSINLFNFSENDPYKITSKANASVSYPQSSGTYANNGKDTYTVNGQTVEYPYYKDAQGKKYYFDAMLDTFQRDLAIKKTKALSTSDYLGTARLLHAFSVAYETYAPVHDREWLNYLVESVEGDANPYWGGMWYRWWQADLGANYLGSLVESFNNIASTDAFEVLSNEVGINVREKVLAMFEDSMKYIDEYPNLNHNMDFNIWNGKILLAEALDNPDFVHQTLERIEKFIQEGFLFDGGWKEISVSYHNQSVEGIDEASALLDGYSDPDGYESPRTGTHIDDLDIDKLFPSIGAAMSFNGKLVYPDKSYVPIGDTWAYENYGGSNAFFDSLLLPASQIARITKEYDNKKNQVYLMAAPKYGHNQYDSLNMVLHANGEELLPDIGYTHSYLRAWSQSTLSHNTVTVDRQDMNVDGVAEDSGSITLFKDGSTVSLMSASNPKAYSSADEYERNMFTVTIPNGSIYVLDIFNVEGGSRHEYSLNGPFLSGTTATSSKTMADYNNSLFDVGTTFEYPTSENSKGTNNANDYYAYMYITDVDYVDTNNTDVTITFDTTNANKNTQMKVTNLTKGNNKLFLGDAFSLQTLRTGSKSDDKNNILEKDKAPKMVLRRDGNNLQSKFVTLIEPDSIKANSVSYDENGSGGTIRLSFSGFTDTIYYSNSNTITVDGTTHNARFAFKREYTRTRQANHFEIIGKNTAGDVFKSFRKANGDPINGFEIANTSKTALYGMKNITITHPNGTRNTYQITAMENASTSVYIDIGTMDTGFTFAENVYKQNFFPLNNWSNQGLSPSAIFN